MKEIQQPFFTPIFFLLFFFFTYTTYPSFSLNPKFTACDPVSCTPTGPSIAFPFWVAGRQPPYCGSHGFRTTCSRGTPILSFSGDHYAIKSIHPENQSILVVNSAVLKQKTCPTPLRNISLELTPFTFPPSHYSFSIFYNCTSLPDLYRFLEYKCASNGTHHSFAVFHEGMLLSNVSSQACMETVSVPMDLDYGAVQTMIGMEFGNLTEIMERGFLLRWTAPSCVNCSGSGGRCGFDGTTFVCFCKDGISRNTCSDGVTAASKRNWGLKAGIASSAAVLGMVTMCFVFYLHHRRRGGKSTSSGWFFPGKMVSGSRWGEHDKGGAGAAGIYIFSYNELEEATHKFSPAMELGDGGFGAVYKGKLRDGRCVAVKRLYDSNYKRVEQFMNEVEILTRLRHPNLVFLYGCTSRHCRELLLVYEYVANGTLAEHLHGIRPALLPWPVRLTIAAETASALSYLHSSGIVHRDVKTTNILLGHDMSVKVADFGLSRLFPADVTHVSTAPQGTPGYVDPEYHQCYQLTDRSDVYSYGVVLVELISAKPAVDITRKREEINLSTMATNKIREGAVEELVDPRLGFEDAGCRVREEVVAMAELAFRCLQGEKEMRPSMEEVVECLAGIRGCRSKEGDVVVHGMSTRLLHSPDSLTLSWNSHITTPNSSAN